MSDFFLSLDIAGIFWSPLALLIILSLFIILIFLWGRISFREDYNEKTGQVKPFNSGNVEEINYNVQSSHLYWGFRRALNGFYTWMIDYHDGDLNNYIKWMVIIVALCLLLISGGFL